MESVKLETLRRLQNMSARLMYPLPAAQLYKRIVTDSQKLTGASYGSLFLRHRTTLLRVFSNTPDKLRTEPRKNGRVWEAFYRGSPEFYQAKFRRSFDPQASTDFLYESIVPIHNRGRVIGVLTLLFTQPSKLQKNQLLDILNLFGYTASLAIRKTQLYDDLKEAIRSRDLFLSIAAHELRTPLTTIMGTAELIESRVKSDRVPKLEWPSLIIQESRRMSRLVNELLVVQQIQQGKFQYTWTKLNVFDVLKEAINDISIIYPSRPFQLVNKTSLSKLFVIGDADKLKQVFTNLLQNAHKFSPLEEPIEVRTTLSGRKILIEFEDKGIGIPKDSLAKVFIGFYKVHNQTQGSMGLGLYVAKRIITRHKGTIDVTSKLHKGTIFTITLTRYKKT